MLATVPATGARNVVSFSFFSAVASCACAETIADCDCATSSGFGGSSLTALLTRVELYWLSAEVTCVSAFWIPC